jgi:hypothetical protein
VKKRQAKNNMEEGQLHQSWKKWGFLWARLNTLQRTEGDGDKLLMPYEEDK